MKIINHFRCKKCNEYNKVEMDIDTSELTKKICGVLGCERFAQAKKRIGFDFYEVCLVHKSGDEI